MKENNLAAQIMHGKLGIIGKPGGTKNFVLKFDLFSIEWEPICLYN
jgi:hypothetical protein